MMSDAMQLPFVRQQKLPRRQNAIENFPLIMSTCERKVGSGRRKTRRRDDENFLNRHCIMYSRNNNDDDDYVTLHGVHSSCIEMHFGKFSREYMLKIKNALDE
ncbi:hypothetical protein ACKWTF_000099 [Chironomus riparius]